MKAPIVVCGLGQLGSLYAEGARRLGHPVLELRRGQKDLESLAANLPSPLLCLVATGEADWQSCVAQLPPAFRRRLVLLQNELRPDSLRGAGLPLPGQSTEEVDELSVLSVWFERKADQMPRELQSSLAFGPHSDFLQELHHELGLHCEPKDPEELAFHLARKNLFILGLNLGGIGRELTALALLREGESTIRLVLELIQLEKALLLRCELPEATVDKLLEESRLMQEFARAIAASPQQKCAGRTAADRLRRTVALVRELQLDSPCLLALALRHLVP